MPTLIIGSTQAYSGKTAMMIAIGHILQQQGLNVSFAKPLGNSTRTKIETETSPVEEDLEFILKILKVDHNQLYKPLVWIESDSITKRLQGLDLVNYRQKLEEINHSSSDITLLEGPSNLSEGTLFELSLLDIAQTLQAPILLITRYQVDTPEHPYNLLADTILDAKRQLGKFLQGVIINDVSADYMDKCQTIIKPFLEKCDIPVYGIFQKNNLLRSITVSELVNRLKAKILCCSEKLDLIVESISIGAMNVNLALEFFREGRNMAVITGGDRTEIQLAALETSTHCLILTGRIPPQPIILLRAEDLEIPILSVEFDTLTTVEIINQAFGQVRLHEPHKVQSIYEMMNQRFDISRFMNNFFIKS